MGAEKQNFNEWSWKGLTFPLYLIGLYSRTSHLSRGYISSLPLPASRFCVQQQMCAGHRGAVDLYLLWYGRAKGQIWEDPLRRSQMSTSGPHSPRQGDDACWEITHPSVCQGPTDLDHQICIVMSIGDWSCARVADECALLYLELSIYEAALTMSVLTIYYLFCQTVLPVLSCLLNHIPQLLHW